MTLEQSLIELDLAIANVLEQKKELLEALKGMLENYIELKEISLLMARSDAPEWMPGLGVDGDIHVIAARKVIAKCQGAQEVSNG